MNRSDPAPPAAIRPAPGMREFVALMALLMASNALAIDGMLPALPAIGDSLDVAEDNRRQLIITFFLLGFGIAQLGYGPLADRFGRKPLLIGSLLLYCVTAIIAGVSASFELLLAGRLLQGVAAAGTRVLVVAIVRDRYEGWAMARVMSLVSIIFMLVPILAPAFGQAVLTVASWRFIFFGLALYGLMLILWSASRLPETLAPERRQPLSAAHLGDAVLTVLRTRASIGNAIALTLMMGGVFAFIGSVQQIVFDVFGRPQMLAPAFALIGCTLALSSYANSRLVERIGSRPLLLRAIAAVSGFALLHLLVAVTFGETFWSFVILQALTMGSFGLVGANAGALAMEPLGHIAGVASSVQGLITTVGGALIGLAIGQMFDGTTIPFLTGFTMCGLAGLAVAAWANPRRTVTT